MTQSTAPWIHSGMAESNRAYEAPVRRFLARLVQSPRDHARFLNMLSMLEHIGSRKIMLSQMHGAMNEDVLQHLAEEARHAHFFKRQAERIGGAALPGYDAGNTTALAAARMYFGRLDAGIRAAAAPRDCYGWVSLIVELRACWIYALYHDVLQQEKISLSLKSLLAEETRHLEDMYALCGRDADRLRAFSAMETALFARLWRQIDRESPAALAA